MSRLLSPISLVFSSLIYRYVFREILVPFLACLFVFTGLLFLVRILKLVELVVSKNVPITDVILLFSYVVPRFLEVAIPMALLLGVILAFSRLSIDSELIVMRATGMSLKQLAIPVSMFAFIAAIASLSLALWVRPWANYRLGLGIFDIARTQASAGLVAGIFNDLGPLTLYAERIANEGTRLDNVIIADQRNPEQVRTFVAKHGQIIADKFERTLTLRLFEGSIHHTTGLNYDLTNFDVNNINLDAHELVEGGPTREGKKANEMYISELSHQIKALENKPTLSEEESRQLSSYKIEEHSRFVIPISCFFVAIIAMALGIQPNRSNYSWGTIANVFAGLLTIMCYYVLFAFVSALGKQYSAGASMLMWLPNILLAALGLVLFRLMESEQWLTVSQYFGSAAHNFAIYLGIIDPERVSAEQS